VFRKKRVKSHFLLKQLYVLLRGGVSLTRALELLALQKKEVASELLGIKRAIEEGIPLNLAFKKSGLFPEFFCEMLVAAQTGSNLEEILSKASEWLERMEDFKSKVLNALIYPAIVISLSIIAVIIVLEFIVPKLRKILLSFGQDLPFVSKLMIWTAGVLWWSLIFGLPILVFWIWRDRKRGEDSKLYELTLKVPFVGRLLTYFDFSKWCYVLSLLLSSGMVLPKAVEVASKTFSNPVLKKGINSIVNNLYQGASLSKELSKLSFVPEFLVELVLVGEEGGALAEMCANASEVFTKEVEESIEVMLRWIEPAIVLLLGSIVAYIIVSVILPIMKISSAIR